VLSELARRYPNVVRTLSQQNGGPAAARNTGLQMATHDWIAFLDHDDSWHPDKLSLQLATAELTQADVVFTATQIVDATGRVEQIRVVPGAETRGRIFEALLFDNFITLSSTLVRRSVLLEQNGFDQQWRGVEDWALSLSLAAKGIEFAGIKEPLVHYRWHSQSLSRHHESMQMQRKTLVANSLASPAGRKVPLMRRRRIRANERNGSAWFMAEQSFARAFSLYAQALVAWPFSLKAWKGLLKSSIGHI
jgi:glycosyltransferase involved in cell wall biosynthesis